MTYDPRYVEGVDLFNREEFFEAHETWESLWHDTSDESKHFIQGLIQVASSLHHVKNGNMRGARLLHDSGLGLLAPYGDFFKGIDIKKLREGFEAMLEGILHVPLDELLGRGHPGPVRIPYRGALAPKIVLAPEGKS